MMSPTEDSSGRVAETVALDDQDPQTDNPSYEDGEIATLKFLKNAKSISGFAPIFAGFTGFVVAINETGLGGQGSASLEQEEDVLAYVQKSSFLTITLAFWIFIGITWHTHFIYSCALRGYTIKILQVHLDVMEKLLLPFAILCFFFGMQMKMFLVGFDIIVPLLFTAGAISSWLVYAFIFLVPWSCDRSCRNSCRNVDQPNKQVIDKLLKANKIP